MSAIRVSKSEFHNSNWWGENTLRRSFLMKGDQGDILDVVSGRMTYNDIKNKFPSMSDEDIKFILGESDK